MNFRLLGLAFLGLALTGCVQLAVTPRPAGELTGARFVTTQPLNLYGALGHYPDRTVTSYFVVPFRIANRFHAEIGTVPAETACEIVDVVDRTALGVPHSRIYRVRLAPDVAGRLGLKENLVEISNHRLIEQVEGDLPRLREEFFRRNAAGP